MHFTHLRTTWQWLAIGCPTPEALEELDVRQYQSWNGDDGGTWNPAAPIVIGGAGITVANPTTLSKVYEFTTDAGAAVSLPSTATIALSAAVDLIPTTTFELASATTFQSGATMVLQSGAAALAATGAAARTWESGSTLSLNGTLIGPVSFPTGFAATFQSGSSLTFNGTSKLAVLGAFTHGTGTFTPSAHLWYESTASVTRSGPETISGSAAITVRRYGGNLTSDVINGVVSDFQHIGQISPLGAAFIVLDASFDSYRLVSQSDARTFVLHHSGALGTVVAKSGMRVRFSAVGPLTTSGVESVTFVREDGSVIAESPRNNSTGAASWPWWLEFEFRFGQWHVLSWGHRFVADALSGNVT